MIGRWASRRGLAVAGVCGVLLVGTACTDTRAEVESTRPAGSTRSPAPRKTTVTVAPVAGASAVRPDTPVTVTATGGELLSVALRDEEGDKVPGAFDRERSRWTSVPRLRPGARYTVTGAAGRGDGTSLPISSTFRTLEADSRLKASVAPLDGETVGVAMPIQIYWNHPVKDRAAVEKRLSVKASVPVEGSWHWLSDEQVNYRPKEYWPVGTKVTVNVDTRGVDAGAGLWGVADRSIDFAIGRSVVTRIDVKSHRMTVEIGGKPVRTLPITAGKDGFTTRSGVKVIMEKYRTKRMDARTVGIQPGDPEYYDIRNVQYAQRVTTSGEFVHGAPWSGGSQGRENVSHGCVGMSLKDGAWYFAQTLRGDPVVVTGTSRRMEAGNGWTDWNDSWASIQAGSALN